MSGLCPFALHKIIPPGSSDPRITPRVAILHVDAGNAHSLEDYFRTRSGGIESHFHVRADGVIEQYRDIYWQADANHLANDFAVSIETQGYGAGEWNADQLASIKRLLSWLNAEAGIPLVKCPRWDGAGVGYHIQFGSPGAWTPVAKSCPGPDRVRQFHDVLVPWMAEPQAQEDDMFSDDDREVLHRIERMTRAKLTRVNTRLARANDLLRELRGRDTITPADLDAAVGELEAALSEAGDGDTRA